MSQQFGGFNICDETNNEYMLPKIKAILRQLEQPGEGIEFINEIKDKFNQCYEILLDFYTDNSYYNQIIIKDHPEPNFVSEVSIRKFHINYGALILLSFLSELEINYLLYKGNYDKRLDSYTYNTISEPNNNNLKLYWSDNAINSYEHASIHEKAHDKKRIYKDSLTIDFRNNENIIQTIDNFCHELNEVFERFCNQLLDNLVKGLNVMELGIRKFYTRAELDVIFWYKKSPNNIYENWREELIRNVATRSNFGNESYSKTVKIILTVLTRTVENFSNNAPEIKYYIDGYGFFSWMYLDQYSYRNSGVRHYGNCFTQTLIEHFLLHGVHLKKNSINIAGFYEDIQKGQVLFNRRFANQYILTDKALYNKLSNIDARVKGDEWDYLGITHWGTKIYNDINMLDGIKIKINPSVKTLRVFGVGKDLFLPGANPNTRFLSYKPFSIFDDKWNYLRALLYPIFDSMVEFIDFNNQIISRRMQNVLIEDINSTFNYIENIVKRNEKMSISVPLNNIKQRSDDNINLDNIDSLVEIILRKEEPFIINGFNSVNIHKTNDLFGKIFNQQTFIIEKNEPDPDEEKKKNLKDKFKNIITKFIVFEFYKSINTTYKFFKLINDTFNEGINQYIKKKKLPLNSINFMFKGGNILRLVVETYVNELPGNVRKDFQEIINTNFRKSDADFQINIKDLTLEKIKTVDEMKKIEEEVTTLAYLLLYRIRNEILTNQKSYIDYYNLDFDSKKILLKKLLDTLNNVKNKDSVVDDPNELNNTNYKFTNITFDNVSLRNTPELIIKIPNENEYEIFGTEPGKDTRKDFSITIEESNPRKYHLNILPYLLIFNNSYVSRDLYEKKVDKEIYKDRSDTNFYITVNKTIPNFILVRMKVSMKLEYSNCIENMFSIFPGEFIDVSIPKYTETNKYFDPLYIKKYEIKGNNPFKFLSFSIDGFIKDLLVTLDLNKDDKFPWDTPKYDVRLNRLFTLFFIDLLSNYSNEDCIQIINFICAKLINLTKIKYIKDDKNINPQDNLCSYIDAIEAHLHDFIFLENYKKAKLVLFFEQYLISNSSNSIITKIKATKNFDTLNKFYTMIENIVTLLDIFKSTLDKNKNYKEEDNISIKEKTDLELSDLNSKNINIKYDKKYLLHDTNHFIKNTNSEKDFKHLYLKYKNKYLNIKKKLNN